MKKPDSAYVVRLGGMKLGVHQYDFEVNKAFFESRDQDIVEDGSVSIQLKLEKKETMMVAYFSVAGKVFTQCDRCADPIEVPVSGDYRVVYKFGTEISDDENLVVLDPETFELELEDQLMEWIIVSLPSKVLHVPGECNEEMMKLYETYTVNAGAPDEEWDDDFDEDDYDEDESDDDWSDEDGDDEDWSDEDDDEPLDPDAPIDPRWAALKQLK